MVDGQVNALPVGQGAVRQQAQRGDVHADHRVRDKPLRRSEPVQIACQQGGGVLIEQSIGGLAQLLQPAAQSSGAADGVAVGALVGQDQVVVMGAQKRCRFPVIHGSLLLFQHNVGVGGVGGLDNLRVAQHI